MAPPNRQERERAVKVVTWTTLAANLGLAGAKLLVGLLGGNQALVADGVHSLSDAVTDGLVLVGAPLWNAPPDDDHPHGHGRIETLLSLLIGLLLAGVGFGLVWKAFESIAAPEPPRLGGWVIGAALASLAVNEALYRWSVREGRRVKAQILVANAWHHRSDGLSSVPVALSAVVAYVRPDWAFVDPLAAVIVSAVILKAAWEIALEAIRQLIDAGATVEECERIRDLVLAHPEVVSMHALRSRHIGHGLQVDLHIQVDAELSVRRGHDIAHETQARLLEDGPNVCDVLVHVEPDDGHVEQLADALTGDIARPPARPSA